MFRNNNRENNYPKQNLGRGLIIYNQKPAWRAGFGSQKTKNLARFLVAH